MKQQEKGIKISPLPLIGEDERGSTHHILNDRNGNFILAYRKQGSSSGRHYHTGKAAYKDPEILYLITGEARFNWKKIEDDVIHTEIVKAPARVEIMINIWHELEAVTDCCFWEMNSLEDIRQDSIRVTL